MKLSPDIELVLKLAAEIESPPQLSDVVEVDAVGRRVLFDQIRSEKHLDLLIKDDRVHPEAHGLIDRSYQIAGTINYGPLRFRKDSEASEHQRESVLRQLMSRIRIALNLRGKDFFWVASTEFGYGNRPHGHFLISFSRQPANIAGVIAEVREAFAELAKDLAETTLGDLQLSEVSNSIGAVAYLCKEEYGHRFKTFYYSTSLVKRD